LKGIVVLRGGEIKKKGRRGNIKTDRERNRKK
jgi:hypothetical protein